MGTRFSQGRRKPASKEKPSYDSEKEQTPFVSEKEINYLTQMFQFVNDDRKKGEFCDTIVASRNQYFMVHSIMLACNSYIFRNIAERYINQNKHLTIYVDSIKPHIFELLLEYIYTGKLCLKRTNVAEVSMAAMDLKIPNICERCTNFIQDMDLEQALIIILTKNIPLSNQVFRKAYQFVENNFSKVCEHELYMEIEINLLSRLLSSDNLNIRWELEVLDNLLKWTYHRFKDRNINFTSLVKHVRFTQMTIQELRYACTMAKLFRESRVCEMVIAEAVRQRYQLLRGDLNNTTENPRNCFKTAEEKSTAGANNCLTSSILEGNIQSKPNISSGESCLTNVESDLVSKDLHLKLNSKEIYNYNRNCQFSPNVFNDIHCFMGNSLNTKSCENISSIQLNERDGKMQTQSEIESNFKKSPLDQFKEISDVPNQLRIKSKIDFKSDLTKQKAVTPDSTAQINVAPVSIEKSVSVSKGSNAIDLSNDIYNLLDCTTSQINPLYVDKESKWLPLHNSSKIKTICGQTKNLRIKQQSKMQLFIKSSRLKINNKISKILCKRTSGGFCMPVRRKKPTIIRDSYLALKSSTGFGDAENSFINYKKHLPSTSHIFSKKSYDRVKYIKGGFSNCALSNSEAGSGTESENDENSNNENKNLDQTGVKLDCISEPDVNQSTFEDEIEDGSTIADMADMHGTLIRLTQADSKLNQKWSIPDLHRGTSYGTNISIKTPAAITARTNVTSAYIWDGSSMSNPVIMMKNTDFNYNLPNVRSVITARGKANTKPPDLTTFLSQRRNSIDVCTDLLRFSHKSRIPKKSFSDEVLSVWETELRNGITEAAEKCKHNVLFNKKPPKVKIVSRIDEEESSTAEMPVTKKNDKNNSQNNKSEESKPGSSKESNSSIPSDNLPNVNCNIENDLCNIETKEDNNQENVDNSDPVKEETSLDLISNKAVVPSSSTAMPLTDNNVDKYLVDTVEEETPNANIPEEPISTSITDGEPGKPEETNIDIVEKEKDIPTYSVDDVKRYNKSTNTQPPSISDPFTEASQPQENDTFKYVVLDTNRETCELCENIKASPTSASSKEISQSQRTRQPGEINIDLGNQEQDTVKYIVVNSDRETCNKCKNIKAAPTSASSKEISQPQGTRQPREINIDLANQEQDTFKYVVLDSNMEICNKCKNIKAAPTSASSKEISQSQGTRQPGEINIDLPKQEQDTVKYIVVGSNIDVCNICKNLRDVSSKDTSQPQDFANQEQDNVKYVVVGSNMDVCNICKNLKAVSSKEISQPQNTRQPQETREPQEINIDLANQEQDEVEYVVVDNNMDVCNICKNLKAVSSKEISQPQKTRQPQGTRQPQEFNIDLANQEQDTVQYAVSGNTSERCNICKHMKAVSTSIPSRETNQPQEHNIDLAEQNQTCQYCFADNIDNMVDVSSSFLTFQEPCCCCNNPSSFENEFAQILEDIAQPCCTHLLTRNLTSICEDNLLSCCSSTSSMESYDFIFANPEDNFNLNFTNIS